MTKIQTMSIKQFMNKDYLPSPQLTPIDLLKKHKKSIEIIGTVAILGLFGLTDFGFTVNAAELSQDFFNQDAIEVFNQVSPTDTLSVTTIGNNSIDTGAKKIYAKLLNVGKWVIIFKGAWDTINNTIKEDFDKAKRSFLQYLLIYLILLAFPWALDEVDSVFSGM